MHPPIIRSIVEKTAPDKVAPVSGSILTHAAERGQTIGSSKFILRLGGRRFQLRRFFMHDWTRRQQWLGKVRAYGNPRSERSVETNFVNYH